MKLPDPFEISDIIVLNYLRGMRKKAAGWRAGELCGGFRYLGSIMYDHGWTANTLSKTIWRDYAKVMSLLFEEYEAVAVLRGLNPWEDGDDGLTHPAPADIAAQSRIEARSNLDRIGRSKEPGRAVKL